MTKYKTERSIKFVNICTGCFSTSSFNIISWCFYLFYFIIYVL